VAALPLAAEFHALRLGDPVPVSAAQGLGTGDLLDRIAALAPPPGELPVEDTDAVRLAVIGRPNVGKSSLVNRFLGAERVIVSDQAGTTRDSIDMPLEYAGPPARDLVLVDTAGLRRQAKVSESVEYYTALRSRRAAERADVALVVCDATDGITSQDLRVAELAMRSGCATALVLNKWDVAQDVDLEHERARAHRKLRLRPRVLTASAKTGRHVERLLVEALALADRSRTRIPTPQLNRFLSEVVGARQPPAGTVHRGGTRLKLLFMIQTGVRPPRFSIQVNSRSKVTREYAYYLENRLRDRYGLDGVPLIIDFVQRSERRGGLAQAGSRRG
jgi:GTP-binding protein